MNNYQFCTKWVIDQGPPHGIHVLDYGCGAGQVVSGLRKRGVDAYGCDVFYEGGDYSKSTESGLLSSGIIRKMPPSGPIPFGNATFEIVINNQVMEHVEDLRSVLAEIRRVLKPRGVVLSLFPDRGVWREGHCGIPFLHRFRKGNRLRVYYAAAFRAVGFGYHHGTKSAMSWSQQSCEWLDKWTHYRDKVEIESLYKEHFVDIQHIEDYWLQLRLGRKSPLVDWMPALIRKLVVRKLGGMVFTARNPP